LIFDDSKDSDAGPPDTALAPQGHFLRGAQSSGIHRAPQSQAPP